MSIDMASGVERDTQLDTNVPLPGLGETVSENSSIAEELRDKTTAVVLSINKWGSTKALTSEQRDKAASEFHAEGSVLSASKKLLNTKHPKYKAVTSVLNWARDYVKAMTVEFPLDSVRLLRTDRVDEFEAGMAHIKDDLRVVLNELDESYETLKQRAQHELGTLYDESSYPASIKGCFGFSWKYVSIEPDNSIESLHPVLYAREQRRVAAEFQEAVALTEAAFASELQDMMGHLIESLEPDLNGKCKHFRGSSLDKFGDFIERFGKLNLGSSKAIEEVVRDLKGIMNGVDLGSLKKSEGLREIVKNSMEEVKGKLESSLVARPTRRFK